MSDILSPHTTHIRTNGAVAILKPTPLKSVHEELGARLVDFAGWAMPLRYQSETLEHRAVRAGAGLFDLSHMGELEVLGPHAARFLDFALVGAPSRVDVGRAKYSMICAPEGGVLDDLIVYRLGDFRYLVVANASNVDIVRCELEQRSRDFDVAVLDRSTDFALVAVQGPRSAVVAAQLLGMEITELRYYDVMSIRLASSEAIIARTGYTGEDGFEIFCDPGAAEDLWRAAMRVGAEWGLVPVGLAARDSLRLEAGMPLYGMELSRSITPFEAGLGRTVVFDKGEGFVGDRALARISREKPKRHLVGLRGQGRRPLRHGCTVVDRDGARVGVVTSGVTSPTLGYPIAMAYVESSVAEPGQGVLVQVRGDREQAMVVELPFYRRAKSDLSLR